MYMCLSECVYVCMDICLSVCIYVCLSVCVCVAVVDRTCGEEFDANNIKPRANGKFMKTPGVGDDELTCPDSDYSLGQMMQSKYQQEPQQQSPLASPGIGQGKWNKIRNMVKTGNISKTGTRKSSLGLSRPEDSNDGRHGRTPDPSLASPRNSEIHLAMGGGNDPYGLIKSLQDRLAAAEERVVSLQEIATEKDKAMAEKDKAMAVSQCKAEQLEARLKEKDSMIEILTSQMKVMQQMMTKAD
eukprot:GFYU01005486.1.p2 GENE.GFYU01005486.1~~GFYU01005486.1.p2  ORF type:complete len:243 (-),score=34.40 GFYU01005486.1:125-853(-)